MRINKEYYALVYKLGKEEFIYLIKSSKSRKEVFRVLEMGASGSSYRILNRRIKEENIDTSHFEKGGFLKGRVCPSKKEDKDVFCEKSSYSRESLKRRLINLKLLEYKCEECGNLGFFNDKSLTLQLDHINGVNNDNRVENLRFLCPNCHSQTETFSGKCHKINREIKICGCGREIKWNKRDQTYCTLCGYKNRTFSQKTKVEWPNIEDFQKLLWEKTTVEIAKDLGVSDVAISKFCKKNNLTKPSRGYWQKEKARIAQRQSR